MKEENILSVKNPGLVKQWHPTKNNGLTPNEVNYSSRKIVWWKCDEGHEWKDSVTNRYRKGNSSCPICLSFGSVHPDLLTEWNSFKNGQLSPFGVSFGSAKKVWWICEKGHEWQATIVSRHQGNICSICNSLGVILPEIAKQWHPERNGNVTPFDVSYGSGKKVWWLCHKGHEWQATINSRNQKSGCPHCIKKGAEKHNSLEYLYPELAIQWHPTKNGDLKPSELRSKSHRSVWWKCNKGHEWNARIYSRVSGRNCPECNKGVQTSFPEQAIYFYLKKVFPDAENRYKPKQFDYELDIYIPSLNLGIEYDGGAFHKEPEKDIIKNLYFLEKKITILRIRGSGCPILKSESSVNFYCKNKSDEVLQDSIRFIFEFIKTNYGNQYHFEDNININSDRMIIYSLISPKEIENSLENHSKKLSKQWHYQKNGILTPKNTSFKSNKIVWWICEKGHEWETSVCNMTNNKNNCPYCSNQKVCKDNSLNTLMPQLASQWHPTKNNSLTADEVTCGSRKKVWWKCKLGHEWDATINSRVKGSGCPYCSGRKPTAINSLQFLNPEVAKQWHPTKNNGLTPNDFTSKSGKSVWWKCDKGHEWIGVIANKTKTNGCPYCSNQRVCEDNSLENSRPDLALEWHYTKNTLTPKDITYGSEKKVWWICDKGHEWETTVNNRSKPKGTNCPICKKNK